MVDPTSYGWGSRSGEREGGNHGNGARGRQESAARCRRASRRDGRGVGFRASRQERGAQWSARAAAVPVLWVQHSDEELAYGSPQWQWVPELMPLEDEILIHKQYNSCFQQTELETKLATLGATHIALAGAATNWCIRATAYGALDLGYDLTLIEDAHTTGSMELDGGVKIEAANVIDELNVCMRYVSYPHRTNSTATAETIDFSQPGGEEAQAAG